MGLSLLEYLVAVADERNSTRAVGRPHILQSHATRQIRGLNVWGFGKPLAPFEHELGFGAKGATGVPKPQMFNQGFGAKDAAGGPKPQMFKHGIAGSEQTRHGVRLLLAGQTMLEHARSILARTGIAMTAVASSLAWNGHHD